MKTYFDFRIDLVGLLQFREALQWTRVETPTSMLTRLSLKMEVIISMTCLDCDGFALGLQKVDSINTSQSQKNLTRYNTKWVYHQYLNF